MPQRHPAAPNFQVEGSSSKILGLRERRQKSGPQAAPVVLREQQPGKKCLLPKSAMVADKDGDSGSNTALCPKRIFPSAEALGKENLLSLNEWQPLRVPAGMERRNKDRGPPSGDMFLAGRSSTKCGSPVPGAIHTTAEKDRPAFLQPHAAPYQSGSTLRPVRQHPRYAAGTVPSSATATGAAASWQQRQTPHSETHSLNKTWPNGREAWARVPDANEKGVGGLISKTGALSLSAPSLSERVAEMFGDDPETARKKKARRRSVSNAGTPLRPGDSLALSLPSVIHLPSIAEESSIAGGNARKRRKQGAAGVDERIAERRMGRRNSKTSAEEQSFIEEHEYRKMRKSLKGRKGDYTQKEAKQQAASREKLDGLLPELSASTPYLTANGYGKETEHKTHARQALVKQVKGSLDSIDGVDCAELVVSDSDVEVDELH